MLIDFNNTFISFNSKHNNGRIRSRSSKAQSYRYIYIQLNQLRWKNIYKNVAVEVIVEANSVLL